MATCKAKHSRSKGEILGKLATTEGLLEELLNVEVELQDVQGPELKRDDLEQLVIQLILDRVSGRKLLSLSLVVDKGITGIAKSSKHNKSLGLEFKLDELRKELASTHGGIFPHCCPPNKSTWCTEKPRSIEELEKIIGKLKTEKYGSKVLEEIKTYEIK